MRVDKAGRRTRLCCRVGLWLLQDMHDCRRQCPAWSVTWAEGDCCCVVAPSLAGERVFVLREQRLDSRRFQWRKLVEHSVISSMPG